MPDYKISAGIDGGMPDFLSLIYMGVRREQSATPQCITMTTWQLPEIGLCSDGLPGAIAPSSLFAIVLNFGGGAWLPVDLLPRRKSIPAAESAAGLIWPLRSGQRSDVSPIRPMGG